MNTLFFDLDGTILDVKKRQLAVYHTVAKKMQVPLLSDEEFWKLKRTHTFPVSADQVETFRHEFKQASETPEMLQLDTVFPEMLKLLPLLHQQHSCVLLTKRYHRENLLHQLNQLALSSGFNAILTPHPNTKAQAITAHGFTPQDIVIGDTEEDIQTANLLQITAIAVTWGFRSQEYLERYHPTYIVDSSAELLQILQT